MNYNAVDESGIQNDAAYISSDLSLWTLDFNLFDMLEIPLCHENMEYDEENEGDCPGNGEYGFQVTYKLPSAGDEKTSWLASGWQGTGMISMYAEPDESMKIGECTLDLQTYVTPAEGEDYLLNIPSAAVAAGIVLGALGVLTLIALYCYCCCGRRRSAKKKKEKSKNQEDDSLPSYFHDS